MPVNSETILTTQTYDVLGDPTQTVTGDKYRGDGYYGRSDGLHTVQYSYDSFSGTIKIQGTLAIDPAEADWFTVHDYTATTETSSKIANFTGNYVWVRTVIEFTEGTINSVILNH